MNFITKILFRITKKLLHSMLKSQKKKPGYIVRQSKGVYLYLHDAETKANKWTDITEKLGSGPVADEIYSMLEEAIINTKVPVKYRCTKCQTTLVDNESELISFGGLGNWCHSCIDECEKAL